MNFFKFHLGDYYKKASHLSMLEDGAYRRLIDAIYLREGPLPADKVQLYRLVKAFSKEEKRAVDSVLSEFFTLTDAGYTNARCEEELSHVREKSEKARQSAFASVEARNSVNGKKRRERITAARIRGTHSHQEWSALLAACDHKCVRCGSAEKIQKDHITPVYQGGSDELSNLQPLCRSCNASKGPENMDFRPADWRFLVEQLLSERSAEAERTLSERSASHKPVTISHKPIVARTEPAESLPRARDPEDVGTPPPSQPVTNRDRVTAADLLDRGKADLSPWETKFLTDMIGRAVMNGKQRATFDAIAAKIGTNMAEVMATWRKRMEAARHYRQWDPKWGPRPHAPGCVAPSELLDPDDGDGWTDWQPDRRATA